MRVSSPLADVMAGHASGRALSSSEVARAFRKGAVGVATDFELHVEGQLVAEGEHPAFEPRMPTDPAPNGTQRDSAPLL